MMLRLFVCFAVLLLVMGCAHEAKTLTAQAIAPFPDEVETPGQQRRLLPWATRTEKASARVELDVPLTDDASTGRTPGLVAAEAWLDARARAVEDLQKRVAGLPASEPPPGERTLLTLGQYMESRPGLRTRVNQLLREAKEDRLLTTTGRGRLEVTLELEPLARAVLDFGGGFSEQTRMGREAMPRTQAQINAASKAEDLLIRQILQYKMSEGIAVEEWVRSNQYHRQMLDNYLRTMHPIRSEETTTEEGKAAWLVEMEIDLEPLLEYAKTKK